MESCGLIKSLGLKVYSFASVQGKYVDMDQLISALDKLPVVYGQKNIGGGMTYADNHQSPSDTHTARILGVETIVREPLRREYETIMNTKTHLDWAEFVGKRVKVVVTEIQEGE